MILSQVTIILKAGVRYLNRVNLKRPLYLINNAPLPNQNINRKKICEYSPSVLAYLLLLRKENLLPFYNLLSSIALTENNFMLVGESAS